MRLSQKLLVIAFIFVGLYCIISTSSTGNKTGKIRINTPHPKNVLNVKLNVEEEVEEKEIPISTINKAENEIKPEVKVERKETPAPKPKPKSKKAKKENVETNNRVNRFKNAYDEFMEKGENIQTRVIEEEQFDLSMIKPGNSFPAIPRQNFIEADNSDLEVLNDFTPPTLPPAFYSTEKPLFNKEDGKHHVIFCATSGSTGTEYLSAILGSANGVNSGQFREPTMKGEWLQMENEKPLSETKKERKDEKINGIRDTIASFSSSDTVYAETSSMFIKNFWDVVIEQDDFNVDVIALRRFLPETVLRIISLGVGEKIQEDEYNTTHSVNSLYTPPIYFPLNAWDRMMRYVVDMELRTQKFIKDTESMSNVRVTEVNLQDINTTKGVTNMFSKLGLSATSATSNIVGVPLPVPRVFKTPSEVRKYGSCSRTMPLTEAKGHVFAFYLRLMPDDIPLMPQMRAPTTYLNRPHRIVGTVIVTKDDSNTPDVVYSHISNKLQFADTVLVAPVGESALSVVGRVTNEHVRVMDSKDVVMKGGSLSYLNALVEEYDKDILPTHIVCYGTKEGLTDSFLNGAIFQQFVLSLEPGEALFVPEPPAEGKKTKHKLVAFALANRLVEFIKLNQELNIEDLHFRHSYLLEEGARMIDWYPTYNIVPIKISN